MLSWPLLSYVALMSVTPGPNNLMLAASGVNFGWRRTVPHMLGISGGHGLQILLVSLLLGWVLALLEQGRLWLALAGCSYLFWLSWQVWRAGAPQGRQAGKPLGFIGAAAFQWVNPKAWVMVVNTSVLFLPHDATAGHSLLLALICAMVNLPCIAVWAGMGDALRHHLARERVRLWFNGVMATAMAATAGYLLWDELLLAGVW
ncbi:LysE family translocator [Vogesella sp. LIG4]|uniref:LysE family translocator n=1 Tax=Vogesella sp. LIG4 TaxID=1192162 RepID=UPI00081FCD9A|nr:LysE family translocator [Vogesella sp. LIG4]SCK19779.1 Threonine/homoserine/homoserine lactone efflux protein [Vogesella sp. LIG4]